MNTTQFQQTNMIAVLERANELLANLAVLTHDVYVQQSMVDQLISKVEAGDDWERASLALVKVELFERAVRKEDTTVEKFPEDWNGGFLHMGAEIK